MKDWKYIAIGLGLMLVCYLYYRRMSIKSLQASELDISYLNRMGLPRGIRNNNPGNIVKTNIPWEGKIIPGKDYAFEQFETFAMGVRAMIIDVKGDIDNDGKNTLNALINQYAPPHENDTTEYIQTISQWTGIGQFDQISGTKETLSKIIPALARYENGIDCISPEIFNYAYSKI